LVVLCARMALGRSRAAIANHTRSFFDVVNCMFFSALGWGLCMRTAIDSQ
jgi:hypothetical protein